MGNGWVFATYLLSGCAGVGLLILLGRRAWYWHVIAVLAALVIGLVRPPGPIIGSELFYVVTGSLFFFLSLWGSGAVVLGAFDRFRRPAPAETPHVRAAGGAQRA